jgi:hypothetical protein
MKFTAAFLATLAVSASAFTAPVSLHFGSCVVESRSESHQFLTLQKVELSRKTTSLNVWGDKDYLIAPSILSADFARLGAEVDNVLAAGAGKSKNKCAVVMTITRPTTPLTSRTP